MGLGMRWCAVLLAAILVLAAGTVMAVTSTIEVSQPVQVTIDSYYERGQSLCYDGSNYWLFYGRSTADNQPYASGSPDDSNYELYYKRASAISGLAFATATQVGTVSDVYQGQTSCAFYDGKVWVFYADASSHIEYFTYDGSWSGPTDTGFDGCGAPHLWVAAYDGNLHIVYNAVGNKLVGRYWDGNSWSAEDDASTNEGMPRLYEDSNGDLLLTWCSWGMPAYYIHRYSSGWSTTADYSVNGTANDDCDPWLFENPDGDYSIMFAPWDGTQQYLAQWTSATLGGLNSATDLMVTQGSYTTSNPWVDMWPTVIDDGTDQYLFFTSERNPSDVNNEIAGNIWYLKVDWDMSLDHYTYIQNAIDAATSTTINVAVGTYREYLHITKDNITLQGAGIDVSIIDMDGLTPYWHYEGCSSSFASRGGVLISGYGNPDEIAENVTFTGFTVKNAGLNPPITSSGTHDGADNALVLSDASASWTPDALIGFWVHNYGDRDTDYSPVRSYGQITDNTATTITATLSGGLENDWDAGDAYVITSYEHYYKGVDGMGDGREQIIGIYVSNAKNVLIEDCKAENCGKSGISATKARCVSSHKYTEGLTVNNCICQNNAADGIQISVYSGSVTITNNVCSNNGCPHVADPSREYTGVGINLQPSEGYHTVSGTISGNTCSDNGFEGIIVRGHKEGTIDGVTVENNTVTGHNSDEDGAGIFLYSTYWYGHPEKCQNVTVRDNTVTGNIRGIVAYNTQHCTIEGNTVTVESGAFDPGQEGIKLDGSNNTLVRDNTISGADGSGMRVQNMWDGTHSFDNTVTENTINNMGFPGIRISSSTHDNDFIGNTISNVNFAGIFIYLGASDNTFENNIVTGTISKTMYAGEAYEETQGDGVFLWGYAGLEAGTGNVFNNNAIYANASDGMENQTTTIVDAEANWWGAVSGPQHATTNPGGTGNGISDYVKYSPWVASSGADADPGTPGWQPDLSAVGVSTNGTIQEGIDLVTASTVYVGPGTYNESLSIGKSLSVVGAGSTQTFVTGGVQIVGAGFDGLILEGMTLSGDAPGWKDDVIDMRPTTGPTSNITIRNCVLDGENVGTRGAFYGHYIDKDWIWEGNEIKNFASWFLIDNTGSSHDVPYKLDTVIWDNNHVHHVSGTVAFRGKIDEPTDVVIVKNSTFDQYVDRSASTGWIWACIEINNTASLEMYNNTMTDVPPQLGGGCGNEGQGLQIWSASPWTVNIHDNVITNNYEGIYIWTLLPGVWWSGPDTPLYIPSGSIRNNDISGNTAFGLWISDCPIGGVVSSAIGGPLNAEDNWWGSCTGPTHTSNPSGTGDAVSDEVDFFPWLCTEPELIATVDTEWEDTGGGGTMKVTDGGDGVVGPGDVLICNLIIENTGGGDATGVTYSGGYEHTTIVTGSVTTTIGMVTSGNNPGDTHVEVDVGTVPGGGTVEIEYQVIIDDPLPPDVTVIEHQGVVGSNESGDIPAEDVHTDDGITRIFIGQPMLHVFLTPATTIAKPGSQFQVCVEVDSATAEMGISAVYIRLTFDSTILDSVKVPTFDGTLVDSSGWDLKWHYYPGMTDTLEMWLIGGGGSGLVGAGPIVCWEFRVSASASPGDSTTLRFSKFWFNEGTPMAETENAFFMVNRPPEFVTVPPETIRTVELHEICYTVEAFDPDGDSLILWDIIDPYPCDGAQPDTVYGRGSVTMEWCWRPPKLGACDTLVDSIFVVSTFETGQPLYDTTVVVKIVEDCELLVMWPDTSWHAGGWIEIPVRIHPDYDCLGNLDVVSADFILDFDPEVMSVGEVGNKGLITEEWGALTYGVNEETGTICVAMAGNYPLPQCDPLCTWYDFFYVGFHINPEAAEGDSAVLSIEHVKFNEGVPLACWLDSDFEVIRYSIEGTVELCSTGVAVDYALMTLTWDIDLDGIIDEVMLDTTDDNGDYKFTHLYGSTGEYCITPSKEDDVGNQTVTSFDASLILRSLCNAVTLDDCQLAAADVTGDGTVSAFDAAVLLKYVVCDGDCGGDFVPENIIGTWLFFPPQRCTVSISEDLTDEDFLSVLVGDVTKNWPGQPSPKVVAGGIDAGFGAKKAILTFAQPVSGLDMTVKYGVDLEPVDVRIEGAIVEWRADGDQLRIAAASEKEFTEVTVEFAEMVLTTMDVSALVDEGTVLTTTAKVVPVPTEFALEQNYPNPFNPTTTIHYALPYGERGTETGDRTQPIHTTLKIYNILGQEVCTLVDEAQEAGYYTVTWDSRDNHGRQLPSGIYFYQFVSGQFTDTKRMALMK